MQLQSSTRFYKPAFQGVFTTQKTPPALLDLAQQDLSEVKKTHRYGEGSSKPIREKVKHFIKGVGLTLLLLSPLMIPVHWQIGTKIVDPALQKGQISETKANTLYAILWSLIILGGVMGVVDLFLLLCLACDDHGERQALKNFIKNRLIKGLPDIIESIENPTLFVQPLETDDSALLQEKAAYEKDINTLSERFSKIFQTSLQNNPQLKPFFKNLKDYRDQINPTSIRKLFELKTMIHLNQEKNLLGVLRERSIPELEFLQHLYLQMKTAFELNSFIKGSTTNTLYLNQPINLGQVKEITQLFEKQETLSFDIQKVPETVTPDKQAKELQRLSTERIAVRKKLLEIFKQELSAMDGYLQQAQQFNLEKILEFETAQAKLQENTRGIENLQKQVADPSNRGNTELLKMKLNHLEQEQILLTEKGRVAEIQKQLAQTSTQELIQTLEKVKSKLNQVLSQASSSEKKTEEDPLAQGFELSQLYHDLKNLTEDFEMPTPALESTHLAETPLARMENLPENEDLGTQSLQTLPAQKTRQTQ